MKLKFLFLGKTRESFLAQGIAEYLGRLKGFAEPKEVVLKAVKLAPGLGPGAAQSAQAEEGRRLLEALEPREGLVLLDPGGKLLSSPQLADWIKGRQDDGLRGLCFGLGGPLGLDQSILKKADLLLSLGPLTLTHEMARLIVVEQVYRAFTIIAGHPYHK